jgi:hypothetical protein
MAPPDGGAADRLRAALVTEPPDETLGRPVHAGGVEKPYGELTVGDVRAHAAELSSAVGWGPTARVGAVAAAWRELAAAMAAAGAATVADLGPEAAAGWAERLWVVPPRGGLLR